LNRLNLLPLLTVCFCLGICLIKWVRMPFLFLYIFTWVFLILSFLFIKHKTSFWFILILTIHLGGLFLSNTYNLAYPHIRNFTFYKSEPVVIRGVVTGFPEIKSNLTSFVLTTQELSWAGKIYRVSGKVLVKIFRKVNVSYADRLILEGKLFRPYQAKNNRYSYRDYLENQGIYSILTVGKNRPIRYLGKSKGSPLKFIAYKIRDKGEDILSKHLNPTQAGIFSAMILGERSNISPNLRRLFIQTGTVHILAISGLHVGIVAFILELFLKVIGIRRRPRYLLIILLLVHYCLLTGTRPSVIRATIMAVVLLVGFLLRRELQIYHSLSLAALVILVVNPRQMFNLGFQLSFTSVISIVYFSPIIKKFFYTAKAQKSAETQRKGFCDFAVILRFSVNAFCVSLAAWMATLPFIAYYFKIISPVTVLANLVVVPYHWLWVVFCLFWLLFLLLQRIYPL